MQSVRLILPDFNQTWNFLDTFSTEVPNIESHGNPPSENGADIIVQTDMRKETAAFSDYVNAPKKHKSV